PRSVAASTLALHDALPIASRLHKTIGQVPPAGDLSDADRALLDAVEGGFDTVGDLIARHRQRAAISEAMRLVGEANKYITEMEPYKLKDESQQERRATILHVAAQAVSDLHVLLSPFVPHSANTVDAAIGGTGDVAPLPRVEEVEDLDGGPGYPVITGDYTGVPAWGRRPVRVGAPVAKPTPIFTKLDDSVVEEELARLGVAP